LPRSLPGSFASLAMITRTDSWVPEALVTLAAGAAGLAVTAR